MEMEITANARAKLRRQLRQAARLDPGIGELLERIGYPTPRPREASYATLLQVIVSQQISTRAAAAVWAKLCRHCGGRVTWRKVLNRDVSVLRNCGLSVRKAEYARGLAEQFRSGQLDMDTLRTLETREVVDRLIRIRGFGRWSAEIFAMFALDRRDLFPADDLALQVAVQRYHGLADRPGTKQTALLAESWSPYRSAVALLMWKYYGATTLGDG